MASCKDCGNSSAGGRRASMTASTRRARSLDQTAHETSGCIGLAQAITFHPGLLFVRREGLQYPALEDLNLLLRILQRSLAKLQQLGAALVCGERVGQRQLAILHGRQDRLELGKCGFKGLGRRVGFCHRQRCWRASSATRRTRIQRLEKLIKLPHFVTESQRRAWTDNRLTDRSRL